MGKHKQIQCQQCPKQIRSDKLSRHIGFHLEQFEKKLTGKNGAPGAPPGGALGGALQKKNELNQKQSQNTDSNSNQIVIQQSQKHDVTIQQSQKIKQEPIGALNGEPLLAPLLVPLLVKNKKIGKRKISICGACNKQFRSDNIFKHQRSHENVQIRQENGQFLKAVPISKFEKKGQIFPQNETNFEKKTEKTKIKIIDSNEVSKNIQKHLILHQKQNQNVFIESNVNTVDFRFKKVEENLAGNDVPRPDENVPRPGKKSNRNKEVTCQICNKKLRSDKLQRHLNSHKSIQFRQKNGKFLQRVLRKNNENPNISLLKKTNQIFRKSKRIFKKNKNYEANFHDSINEIKETSKDKFNQGIEVALPETSTVQQCQTSLIDFIPSEHFTRRVNTIKEQQYCNQIQQPIDDGEPGEFIPDECCVICFLKNPLNDLHRISCCDQLLHKLCYDKMVKSRQQQNRETYQLIGIEAAKQEATKCANCRKSQPKLNIISNEQWEDLKQKSVKRSRAIFLKAKEAIAKQLSLLADTTMDWKLTLNHASEGYQEALISSPSISIHTDDINSNDVVESCASTLEVGDVEMNDLLPTQKHELKQLSAKRLAYQRKIKEYRSQINAENTNSKLAVKKLQDELKQNHQEMELELQNKLEDQPMKELAKSEQIKLIAQAFVENKDKISTTEDWLQSLEYCKTDDDFIKVGEPICDAIVLPMCPLLFKENPFKLMKEFLIEQGIHVKSVYKGVKKDTVFVQLSESRNTFNFQLINKLKNAIEVLIQRTSTVLCDQKGYKVNDENYNAEIDRLFVCQIDYTQDIAGFVMFLILFTSKEKKVVGLLEELSKLIGIDYARDYNQLLTSAQFVAFNEEGKISKRVKVYNKYVHLLCSGQFKKKINMHLDKLLNPPIAFFHDKVLPSQETGLSRIELSNYFNSFKDFKANIDQIPCFEEQINTVLNALNELKHKIMYKVSLQLMLNSYFQFCRNQLVAFDNNVQVIVYSYSTRSYTFSGVINNRTRHSPNDLTFLKKFVVHDGSASLFYLGKPLGSITKHGSKMQYPIISLNCKHEDLVVKAETKELFFDLTNIKSIKVKTNDQETAKYLGLQQDKTDYTQDQQIIDYGNNEKKQIKKTKDFIMINTPVMKNDEPSSLVGLLQEYNLEEKIIKADGNCLFSAVADQVLGSSDKHNLCRDQAVNYMKQHENQFAEFVEDNLSFNAYIRKISQLGTWGSQMEIEAMSQYYSVTINILNAETLEIVEHGSFDKSIYIIFHPRRHHYSSTKKNSNYSNKITKNILQNNKQIQKRNKELQKQGILQHIQERLISDADNENKMYVWDKYNKQNFSQKKEENQQVGEVRKTKAGAIIREINENDWQVDGDVGDNRHRKKTYRCLKCQKPGIRSNNRSVHLCKF